MNERPSWRSAIWAGADARAGGGPIRDRDRQGPAIVFVHGALVNANLWRKVVPKLDGFRA